MSATMQLPLQFPHSFFLPSPGFIYQLDKFLHFRERTCETPHLIRWSLSFPLQLQSNSSAAMQRREVKQLTCQRNTLHIYGIRDSLLRGYFTAGVPTSQRRQLRNGCRTWDSEETTGVCPDIKHLAQYVDEQPLILLKSHQPGRIFLLRI